MPDHVLHILVEGPTETTLLQSLLSGHLGAYGVRLAAPTELRGNVTFERVVRESCLILKKNPGATVTTFFDYYGRGRGWLDRNQAQNQPAATLGRRVERLVYDKVVTQFTPGGSVVRFVPYVQLYELEALMFSMPDLLLGVFQDMDKREQVMSCLREVPSCEEINTENFPAKRLKDIFGRYKKGDGQRSQARSFAEQADLASVRAACPRFSEWVSMLEKLPNLPPLPPPV
jgi:hypothetical protein